MVLKVKTRMLLGSLLVLGGASVLRAGVIGDVDGDLDVDNDDVARIQQFAVGLATPTPEQFVVGDLDADGQFSARDAVLLLIRIRSHPTDVYVDGSYTGTEDGSREHPFSTIQAGLNAASNFGRVMVASGTYTEHLTIVDKVGVSLLGGYSAAEWSRDPARNTTVIDGQATGRCINISNSFVVLVDGFQMTGGMADEGGAIRAQNSSLTLQRCAVRENTAIRGGAVYCTSDTTADIFNSLVIANTATLEPGGGAVACANGATVRLINDTIVNNSGGVVLGSDDCVVVNCIISTNATTGVSTAYTPTTGPLLDYNDVWNNAGGNYVSGLNLGQHDISMDPGFVSAGDYHLSELSPCSNRGTSRGEVSQDIDGDPRPQQVFYDIGADESDWPGFVIGPDGGIARIPTAAGTPGQGWINFPPAFYDARVRIDPQHLGTPPEHAFENPTLSLTADVSIGIAALEGSTGGANDTEALIHLPEMDSESSIVLVVDDGVDHEYLPLEITAFVQVAAPETESQSSGVAGRLKKAITTASVLASEWKIRAVRHLVSLVIQPRVVPVPPDPQKNMVLFVHGLLSGPSVWDTMRTSLPACFGYYEVQYNWMDPIAANGEWLANQLNALDSRDVDNIYVIAHSMGAPVSRHALEYGHANGHKWAKKVRKWLSLGGVNDGTPLAAVAAEAGWYMQRGILPIPVVREILNSDGVNDLTNTWFPFDQYDTNYFAVAGLSTLPVWRMLERDYFGGQPNDGAVTVASQRCLNRPSFVLSDWVVLSIHHIEEPNNAAVIALAETWLFPETVYVSAVDGDDYDRSGVERDGQIAPFATIQHAIDSVGGTADRPVVIKIKEGTYVENVWIDGLDNNESLYGGYDANWERGEPDPVTHLYPNTTTIDGSGQSLGPYYASCLIVAKGYPGSDPNHPVWNACPCVENIQIDGLRLINGSGTGSPEGYEAGGGAIFESGSWNGEGANVISHCELLNSSAAHGGGIVTSYARIVQNYIHDNHAYAEHHGGGGIYSAKSIIDNNRIERNSAQGNGGGICGPFSAFTIYGNTIVGNTAGRQGGGIWCFQGYPVIGENTIMQNSAGLDGGGVCYEYNVGTPERIELTENVIAQNSALRNGGGIYCYGPGTISGGLIYGNYAQTVGGGVYYMSDAADLSSAVYGNTCEWRVCAAPCWLSQDVCNVYDISQPLWCECPPPPMEEPRPSEREQGRIDEAPARIPVAPGMIGFGLLLPLSLAFARFVGFRRVGRKIAVIVLLIAWPPVRGAEVSTPAANVRIGVVQALEGATGIVVPVYLESTVSVAGFDLDLQCDPELGVTAVRAGAGIGSLVLVANVDTGIPGQVRLNAVDYSLTGVAGQLSIVELIVDVPPGSQGLLPVAITQGRLTGLQAETIASATTDGGVCVGSKKGDFDCDCDVDLADYSEFNACLTGPEVSTPPACNRCDFDDDGNVDLGDFATFQAAFMNNGS